MTKKLPLIILSGPTAVGKTELSIALAKEVNGEIISADSMQVYRRMDIGTAKISKEEMQGVPHHLIDILEPWETFNVVKFKELVTEKIKEICARGRIPILAGGTGFYIQSVLYDIEFEEQEGTLRKELEAFAKEHGDEALYRCLLEEDPVTAATIHPNNTKKVIRALEFFRETKKSLATHNEEQRSREPVYQSAYFVLTRNREVLYDRINLRVDQMVENGLLEEVQHLMEENVPRSSTAMAGLGYKEIYDYYQKELTLEEAVEKIKKETRHFAKRQLTWFRREKDVIWLSMDEIRKTDEMLSEMKKHLAQRGIISK